MGALSAFAPFISFVLVEKLIGPVPGLAAAALSSFVLLLNERRCGERELNILEAGSGLMFATLAVLAMTGDAAAWSLWRVRLWVDLGLLLIVLSSIAVRSPFTLQHARRRVSPEVARSAAFVRVNDLLSGVRATAFAVRAAADALMAALQQGIADARAEYREFALNVLARRPLASADLFGSRQHLRNRYLHRYAGAVLGIFGNSIEEAVYFGYYSDTEGAGLDASKRRCRPRFAPGRLPPAAAFWSITLYDAQTRLLVDNPLQRYLINSHMLDGLVRDVEGG